MRYLVRIDQFWSDIGYQYRRQLPKGLLSRFKFEWLSWKRRFAKFTRDYSDTQNQWSNKTVWSPSVCHLSYFYVLFNEEVLWSQVHSIDGTSLVSDETFAMKSSRSSNKPIPSYWICATRKKFLTCYLFIYICIWLRSNFLAYCFKISMQAISKSRNNTSNSKYNIHETTI